MKAVLLLAKKAYDSISKNIQLCSNDDKIILLIVQLLWPNYI